MTGESRDPVAGFAARLRALREEAGEPSLNRLVELTKGMTWPLKRSTIGDKLNGRSVISWEFVSSFVTACVAHAQSAERPLPPELVELGAWDQAHAEMLDAVAADRTQALQAKAARSERARRAARSSLLHSPRPASGEGHDQPALGAATGPVRTYYQEQVERIAPPDLIGRERELVQLAKFCTSQQPGSPSYTWWRAKAWSGKTALMSWFVLNPPPEVRIVSFFVTARFYSQNDRAAFIDNLMEQLLALLGKPLPPLLTEATREAHLLGLLTEASEACQRHGERLVLLVDGLDEDRGAHEGPDAHSIAALLPSTPPAGMRVILAGRPDPPIPTDVPPDHPLRRDNAIIRSLAASPEAHVIREEAERELQRLLHGTVAERDLLGLVAAAGGGLSAADLAELTPDLAESPWEVENRLKAVAGRSFSRRGSAFRRHAAWDVYLLGHEELQVTAVEMLGPLRMKGYQERLHNWAQRYRAERWPPNTPEYLLRSYFNLLHATGDVTRMTGCAADLSRQDRMRDLSGGDAAALTEIITTQDMIVTQEDPDLVAMVRLAIHRDHLAAQNENIPLNLPTVWALLGQVNRAEVLARSTLNKHGWDRQAGVLASVAKAAARVGDLDRAEATARSITDPFARAKAVVSVAEAAVRAGDSGRAATLIDYAQAIGASTSNPKSKALTLALVAGAAAWAGDSGRAATLIDLAEAIARSITEASNLPSGLVPVAEATAKTGDLDRAEAMARSITTKFDDRDKALASVAREAAKAGNVDRAEAIANSITGPYWRTRALAWVAGVAAGAGDSGRAATLIVHAEAAAGSIAKLESQAWSLCSVAEAAAKAGDLGRAGTLIGRAEGNARSIDARSSLMLDQQARVLVSVAETAAKAGDLTRAETITRSITVLKQQAWALASVAEVVAKAGDLEQARALIMRAEAIARIPDPLDQQKVIQGLGTVAEAAVEAGDLDGAASMIVRAEAIARSISPPAEQNVVMALAAEAAAKAGDLDRADAITGSIPDYSLQAHALMRIGEVIARAGDFDQAGTLLGRAKSLARYSERNDFQKARSIESSVHYAARPVELSRVKAAVKTAARAGDMDRAWSIADSVRSTDKEEQAGLLVSMAEAVAEVGDLEQARALVMRAEAIAATIRIGRVRSDPFEGVRPGSFEQEQRERAVRVLALLAEAVAKAGDSGRAGTLVVRAGAIAASIAGAYNQARALVPVAEAVAEVGDLEQARALVMRAEAIAASITDRFEQGHVLAFLVEAVTKVRDFDRAEAFAASMDSAIASKEQAQAFLALTASQNPRRRARAVARALRIADWHLSIRELIKIAPEALGIVLAEIDLVTGSDIS